MFSKHHLAAIKAVEERYGIQLRSPTIVCVHERGFDVVFVVHDRVHHAIHRDGAVRLTGNHARSVWDLVDNFMSYRHTEFFVLNGGMRGG